MNTPRLRGFTLIEMVIFIVIVSVALVGVLKVYQYTVVNSADPLIQKQALTLAEAMMDEVLSKSYQNSTADSSIPGTVDDPNNASSTEGCTPTTPTVCSAAAVNAGTGNRLYFNDVMDYNGLNGTAKQPDGSPVLTSLTYNVTVSVTTTTLNDITARQVIVTVTGGSANVVLTGYRAKYDFN